MIDSFQVDAESTAYGGELVADVLKVEKCLIFIREIIEFISFIKAHGIPYLFCLSGGHISPILVACEKRGIRIIDTRHEANAAFAGNTFLIRKKNEETFSI